MAWAFVGVSAVATVTAASHALTEPAGCQAGDLLVAVISSRIASTTSITLPAGWTLVAESKTNNVQAALTTSEASGMMAYIVRGDDPPALTFTHPTAPSVAMGRIVAYRGGNIWNPFDVGVGAKTGTNITAVSTTGLTTGEANELIVKGVCSGRASAFSAHDAATDPTTGSGTGSVDTAAPTVGTWRERQDSSTTTGADTALAIADAIRGTAGATGALTCTATVAGGHAQVAGAFRIEPVATAGSSSITQTGSVLDFTGASLGEGTVSSTITVPSDAQIVIVAVQGWSGDAPEFTRMFFTKNGVDTRMYLVAPQEIANSQRAHLWYLALPDTGSNKTLKYQWWSGDPAETPLISVTFWKGVDTESPVRSYGVSLPALNNSAFQTRTTLLTAQNGDLVVGFVGGDCGGNAEHSVSTWYNLNLVAQCTNGAAIRHDGAWGSFAPSANLYVGADTSSGMGYGVCAAIVLKPAGAADVTKTDDFNRADNADLGTNWTKITNQDLLQIFSNTARGPDGVDRAEYWNADVFGSTQYSQGKCTIASGWYYFLLRIQENLLYPCFYYARVDRVANTIQINRRLDWTDDAPVLASVSYTVSASDVVRFEAEGSTLRVKVNSTTVLTTTDSTFPDGRVGIMLTWGTGASAIQLDDWGGGEWAPVTSIDGTLAVTEAKDTALFNGTVRWDAQLAVTETKDTLLFNGSVYWAAQLAVTEGKDTLAFNGSVFWAAQLAAVETKDVFAATGSVFWEAFLAASEARDTASFIGNIVSPIDGTLAATEAPDIAAFNGVVTWLATLAASEAPDTANFIGLVLDGITGTLAVSEAPDLAIFDGDVTWIVLLAASENSDFASFTGFSQWTIVMVASEERDIAEFEGEIRNPITGTLAASETPDTVFFEGASAYLGYSQVLVVA